MKCERTIRLICNGLKAGHIHLKNLVTDELVGTPQGSSLSPLLCNIFLHELDQEMELVRLHLNTKNRRRENPEYRKIRNQIKRLQRKGLDDEVRELRKEMFKTPSKDPMDPNFRRIEYVRYADDFIIGVAGPHSLASFVREVVHQKLQALGLERNQVKMVITSFSEGISFLGTEITRRKVAEKRIVTARQGGRNYSTRSTPRLQFHAPMTTLYARAKQSGLFKHDSNNPGNVKPTAMRSLTNLDHSSILQWYNAVIRG